jgi:hypothetical protein
VPSASADERSAWLEDPARRAGFLDSRRASPQVLGSFEGMVSLWYAVQGVPVSCKSRDVAGTRLWTNFPEFYQPTWREYFNAVARQTQTHWYYKDPGYGFMFVEPALPLPFTVEVADGWRTEHYGYWVKFIPQEAPVGMDVYMLGEYSADREGDEAALFDRVRREWALAWARLLDPACTLEDMQTVQLAGVEALYFKGQHPATSIVLHQWILVKGGMCFGIFSAVHPDLESEIWPDVQAMVRSFEVLLPAESDDAGGNAKE